ncbi:MAG: tRNA preQ1(34) S-adenosylmethionine ribosyltransferase-isomerase QueA [Kiritimatiellia bacterium]
MKTKQFWYPLPTRLIAQHPSERRGDDRMMVLHRDTGVIEHRRVTDFPEYVTANDLIVVNDTKVFPARLLGTWIDSPGAVEVLMVSPATDADSLDARGDRGGEVLSWRVMIGSGRPAREGQVAVFGPNHELRVELVKKVGGGMWTCAFVSERPLNELLDEFGHTPVPPYVHREGTREEEMADRERYQTIYAKHVGSVAAPTAGLHFTPEIFAALDAKGIQRVPVTLHVGPGTFRPVKADNIEDHEMDFEAFSVPTETAAAINVCKARGGRVFCVGSTSVRTLETVAAREKAADDPLVVGGSGASNIFIYPPYKFKVCDCMLTNFHLPQSTLLMMTSALAGRERMLCAYALAVRAEYRFFSYGDCMLIV